MNFLLFLEIIFILKICFLLLCKIFLSEKNICFYFFKNEKLVNFANETMKC